MNSVAEMENDFLARLHRCERPQYKQIKLIEAMRGKSKETFEALTGPVHGDEAESSERTDNAWRKLAIATTRSASEFGISLAYDARMGHVHKDAITR